MEHGYMQPIGLRVSSDMPHFILYPGYDGNNYLKTSDGLYLNQDGSRPIEILNWIDAGIRFVEANEALFILNASSVFFTKTETVNGRELTRLYHVGIRTIPEPDRTVVRILAVTAPNDILEEGIIKFNASQNRYRIALDTISEKEAENPEETIQKRLLYDHETDIFLCQKDWLIEPYYDKDAFLDLNPYFGDNLFGCVQEAFGYGDALYMMPVYMTVEMFTALTETVDGYLTWDALYTLTETLGKNEVLTSDTGCAEAIRSNGVMDFVDTENQIAYYDTDDFRRMLLYMESMSDYIDEQVGLFQKLLGGSYYPYVITNGTLPARVRDGGIRLLHTELETLNAYAILKLIYGNKAFSLCGYPSRDGGSAKISGYGKLAVRADSDALDGCIAFLTYLLSDAVQSSDGMCGIGLPVTHSGLSALIETNRFWYYKKSDTVNIDRGTTEEYTLPLYGTTEEYDDTFGIANKTDGWYTAVELTDADKDKLIDYFDHCNLKANVDPKIREIVEEELSFWEGGVRTLEDTTKIIQSRVWIYLNE